MSFSFLNEGGPSTDCKAVLNTAALLETSEFDVFRLAYRHWYGKTTTDELIEQFYTPYMFQEIVPSWVRSFCRRILSLDKSGILDPRKYVGLQLRQKPAAIRRIKRSLILAIISMILLIVLADEAAKQMGLAGRCMFPPCY